MSQVECKSGVMLEESIMQKGKPACAGSKILEGFTAPFDAEVAVRLAEKGIPIAGRVGMDEFGISPISADRLCKLSPAVKAVLDGAADFALCNDVFGKQRRQSAENGVCYIHPSYGTVSRHGLIPMACSMDQIGVVCKSVSEGFGLLSTIAGHDPKDGAMFPAQSYPYARQDKPLRIGLPGDVISRAQPEAQKSIAELAGRFDIVDACLDYFDVYKQVMYILASAEISGNTNRYDGIKFGFRAEGYKGVDDLYLKTRTQGFGPDTKLAAIMGAMALSQDHYTAYYEKAMKIRRLIKQSLRFDLYDIIILPTAISEHPYDNLALFALAPLAGLPCVSFSHAGQGVQLIADTRNESALRAAWEVAIS